MKKHSWFIYLISALLAYAIVADTPLHNYLASISLADPWFASESQLKEVDLNTSPGTVPGQTAVTAEVDTPQAVPVPDPEAGNQQPQGNTSAKEYHGNTADDAGKAADKPPAATAPSKTVAQANTPTRAKPAPANSTQPDNAAQEMLGYINTARAEKGLSPLALNSALCQGAYMKSKDMAVNNYFSHNSPTYGSPFDMMKNQGITYRYAAENIAKNFSVLGSHNAFMNSSGHRANILNPNFKKVGLGFYWEENYLYVTQWFTN